jgi:hypothetical protein
LHQQLRVFKRTTKRPRLRTRDRLFWIVLANVSMDFFTVSTVIGRVLFVLVLLSHECRRIVYFNIAEHPTAHTGPLSKSSRRFHTPRRHDDC